MKKMKLAEKNRQKSGHRCNFIDGGNFTRLPTKRNRQKNKAIGSSHGCKMAASIDSTIKPELADRP